MCNRITISYICDQMQAYVTLHYIWFFSYQIRFTHEDTQILPRLWISHDRQPVWRFYHQLSTMPPKTAARDQLHLASTHSSMEKVLFPWSSNLYSCWTRPCTSWWWNRCRELRNFPAIWCVAYEFTRHYIESQARRQNQLRKLNRDEQYRQLDWPPIVEVYKIVIPLFTAIYGRLRQVQIPIATLSNHCQSLYDCRTSNWVNSQRNSI